MVFLSVIRVKDRLSDFVADFKFTDVIVLVLQIAVGHLVCSYRCLTWTADGWLLVLRLS